MMNCYARSMVGANHAQIPDNLVEEFLQWKPLAEPRFQEAVAEVGVILVMFGVGLHFSPSDLLSVRAVRSGSLGTRIGDVHA